MFAPCANDMNMHVMLWQQECAFTMHVVSTARKPTISPFAPHAAAVYLSQHACSI